MSCLVFTVICVLWVIFVSAETNLCALQANIATLKDDQLTELTVMQVSTVNKRLLQGDPKIWLYNLERFVQQNCFVWLGLADLPWEQTAQREHSAMLWDL